MSSILTFRDGKLVSKQSQKFDPKKPAEITYEHTIRRLPQSVSTIVQQCDCPKDEIEKLSKRYALDLSERDQKIQNLYLIIEERESQIKKLSLQLSKVHQAHRKQESEHGSLLLRMKQRAQDFALEEVITAAHSRNKVRKGAHLGALEDLTNLQHLLCSESNGVEKSATIKALQLNEGEENILSADFFQKTDQSVLNSTMISSFSLGDFSNFNFDQNHVSQTVFSDREFPFVQEQGEGEKSKADALNKGMELCDPKSKHSKNIDIGKELEDGFKKTSQLMEEMECMMKKKGKPSYEFYYKALEKSLKRSQRNSRQRGSFIEELNEEKEDERGALQQKSGTSSPCSSRSLKTFRSTPNIQVEEDGENTFYLSNFDEQQGSLEDQIQNELLQNCLECMQSERSKQLNPENSSESDATPRVSLGSTKSKLEREESDLGSLLSDTIALKHIILDLQRSSDEELREVRSYYEKLIQGLKLELAAEKDKNNRQNEQKLRKLTQMQLKGQQALADLSFEEPLDMNISAESQNSAESNSRERTEFHGEDDMLLGSFRESDRECEGQSSSADICGEDLPE